jgi:uncharacterized SAM-binding protein YcdF (DUF218 family)
MWGTSGSHTPRARRAARREKESSERSEVITGPVRFGNMWTTSTGSFVIS